MHKYFPDPKYMDLCEYANIYLFNSYTGVVMLRNVDFVEIHCVFLNQCCRSITLNEIKRHAMINC